MMSVETKKQIARDRETIRRHKDRIHRLSIIEKGRDGDFWKALAGEIQVSIEANEAERDVILENDHDEDPMKTHIRAKCLARSIRCFKGIKANVDQASDKVVLTNNKIAEIMKRIESAEKETKTSSEGVI